MRTAPTTLIRLLLLLLLGFARWVSAAEDGDPGTPWGKDYFPNTALINQDGQTLHFFDDMIKDKVVAINFIFTSCTDSCPLETARLLQVQKILGDRVGKDVFLYSISIDPETDTPEVLKKYAEKFRIGPGWQFLTGTRWTQGRRAGVILGIGARLLPVLQGLAQAVGEDVGVLHR